MLFRRLSSTLKRPTTPMKTEAFELKMVSNAALFENAGAGSGRERGGGGGGGATSLVSPSRAAFRSSPLTESLEQATKAGAV